MHYGERIKELRGVLSQEAFAQKMDGVSQGNISYWENIPLPPLEGIVKICEGLGMTIWEFFAPKNLHTVEMSPGERQVLKIFKQVPEERQGDFITILTSLVEFSTETVKRGRKKI